MCKILPQIKADERIEDPIVQHDISDTPITMCRNQMVKHAKELGVDVLVMVDSDMDPLKHVEDKEWKEFFSSSFDFLYDHYDRGPCVIGAPYCGPPGPRGENVYVFRWTAFGDRDTHPAFQLEQVTRAEAGKLRGIQEAAALPTGLAMYDMRAFDLIAPSTLSQQEVLQKLYDHEISVKEAVRLGRQGWFYYEYHDNRAAAKASTEDVTNTRDISLAGTVKLGYNPVYCNWDSPAGHIKMWNVAGRPQVYEAMDVSAFFREAVENPYQKDERVVEASDLVKQEAAE